VENAKSRVSHIPTGPATRPTNRRTTGEETEGRRRSIDRVMSPDALTRVFDPPKGGIFK
jgi:hypothetical protein